MPKSRLQEHAQNVLDRMTVEADDEGIWTGSLSVLIGEITGSKSYYSPIIRLLKGAHAITQMKRGGGSAMSLWLVENPDADLSDVKLSPVIARRRTLETRVANLEKLVGNVNVPEAISAILERKGGNDA